MPNLKIGLVVCKPEKLVAYFPTPMEPDFLPTEPPFTPDDQILVNELRSRGHQVDPVIWGGEIRPLVDNYDRLVIRSPWDYMDSETLRLDFFNWLHSLGETTLPVKNDPVIMTWLTDKRYLLDLEQAGLKIVPTRYAEIGSGLDLTQCFSGAQIVKPAVSAAGVGLVTLDTLEKVLNFQESFRQLNKKEAFLIQPLLSEIHTNGEWSLIYIGGIFSHAVKKTPAPGTVLCHAEHGGTLQFSAPPDGVRRAGDKAIERLPQAFHIRHAQWPSCTLFPLLYLRVDLIETHQGPLVSECEGVEPELFFRALPGSEKRFADLLEG
jgi:glutathione synthase/RimK-type ligase-like ATP-grasp enzyme